MTPPSPLYQTQDTTINTRQKSQIMEGIKQARKDAVPTATHAEPDSTHNDVVSETKEQALERIRRRIGQGPGPIPKLSPMLSPVGHENANEDPQVDDHNEETQDKIDPTPITEDKPKKKLTKIIYDRSPMKTPKRRKGRKSQTRSYGNIKNRLGQGPTKVIWSPWMQGQEPRNYREYLEEQLRRLDAQREEEGSSDTQTDDGGAEERE